MGIMQLGRGELVSDPRLQQLDLSLGFINQMNLKHHPVLSTKVVTKDPDPIQAIHHEADYSLPFVFVVCKSKYKFDQFLGKSKSTA